MEIIWYRSSGATAFFLTLFLGLLFAVAASLLVGFLVFGALTFLAGTGAGFLVVTEAVFRVGVVLTEGGIMDFLLLVAMTISLIELIS